MSNTFSILIQSSDDLYAFSNKVAPHTNMGPSKLSHAISKGYGCSHISALNKALDASPSEQKSTSLCIGTVISNYLDTKLGSESDSLEEITESMDELVFDHVSSSKDVNNSGLHVQINAVMNAVGLEPVINLLQEHVDTNELNELLKKARPVDIDDLVSDRESIVVECCNGKSIDDLCQNDFDSIEDGFADTAQEVLWDKKELGKAIDLLRANGFERISDTLINLAKSSAALDWAKENM